MFTASVALRHPTDSSLVTVQTHRLNELRERADGYVVCITMMERHLGREGGEDVIAFFALSTIQNFLEVR